MKPLRKEFISAIRDYIFLLERSYPARTILSLVSTRYSLSATERSILYRGVSPSADAKKRKEKKLNPKKLKDAEKIHIDTLNVLFTIHAYLAGQTVYISTDGYVRDAAEVHGNSGMSHMTRSVELLMVFLDSMEMKECIFYIDKKADSTIQILKALNTELISYSFDFEIIVSNETDQMIENASSGIAATSDSTIINRVKVPVIDLPHEILKHSFDPSLVSIGDFC
jgi:hypothetical protein